MRPHQQVLHSCFGASYLRVWRSQQEMPCICGGVKRIPVGFEDSRRAGGCEDVVMTITLRVRDEIYHHSGTQLDNYLDD